VKFKKPLTEVGEMKTTKRYIVTRMKKDKRVEQRYQREGWMAFDTLHVKHGIIWPTRDDAKLDTRILNRLVGEVES